MASLPFDVAIVGGGPAGAATALALLAHAPSLSVVLIEASRYDACRIGETLPPPARSIFEHLQVWEKFSALNPREVFRTRALWGDANPVDNDFIFMPANTGWHVDRTLFDAMLATAAEERGASLFRGTLLRTIDWADGKWQLRLSSGATLSATFVVDATGGKAVIARRLGARFLELDRLVGLARFFENDETDPSLMVEACEDGWWYTAGLPGGKRVAGCITDSDLAHRMKLGETEQWQRSLATAPAISSILRQCEPCSPVVARSTASHRLDPAATERWLAVGDAASRFDPLSSQGITKALRSGIFASYAIGDWLVREDSGGLRRYQQYLADEFKSYSEVRVKYYRQEQRWPASDFWRRRHEAGSAYDTELVGAAAG